MADTIQLTCSNCGSTMDVTPDREFIFCQFCGAKQLVKESDEVRIEKVKFGTYKDVELSRQQVELEKNRLEVEGQKISQKRSLIIAGIMFLIAIFSYTSNYLFETYIPAIVFPIIGIIFLFKGLKKPKAN